jgi:hypothetical protein
MLGRFPRRGREESGGDRGAERGSEHATAIGSNEVGRQGGFESETGHGKFSVEVGTSMDMRIRYPGGTDIPQTEHGRAGMKCVRAMTERLMTSSTAPR